MKRIEIICMGCGTKFLVPRFKANRKYCTQECSTRYATRPNTKGIKRAPRINSTCPICQSPYTIRQKDFKRGRALTCSKECGNKLRAQRLQRRSMTSPATQKKWLLKEREHLCEDCGYGKIPKILAVHHVDENRANGSPENLLLLCPNCHTERHFFSRTGMFKGLARRSRKVIPENLLSRNERELI